MDIPAIAGWTGMGLIIGAYFLVSYKFVSPTSKTYQVINVIGAVGLGASAFAKASWPNFWLQVVWLVIGLVALIKIIFFNKSNQPQG